MSNFFPLIANVAANVIQELPSGSFLDLSQSGIANSGNISVSGIVSATGNIAGNYFIGNGSQLTGITASANVDFTAVASNIIPTGNSVYSLGNATNQWNDLYLSNATIYMNSVPISMTAGNVLTVNGNDVLQNNSNSTISTTGNISANNITVSNLLNVLYNGNAGLTIDVINPSATMTAAAGKSFTIGADEGNAYIGLSVDNVFGGPGKIAMTGNITTDGNISGNYILGNGSQLTGISGSANTGNVTFNNTAVQGVAGLQLSASPTDTGNLKYLQVRAGDVDSHIHFDTGDNYTYDQYFGDDFKYVKLNAGEFGNVTIGTQNPGEYLLWTFDNVGDLTVPGDIKTITTGFPFTSSISDVDTTSVANAVIVTLVNSSIFPAPVTGQVTISGVVGTTEANGTWYFEAAEANQIQLYNDSALQSPVNGTGWTAYASGGLAVAAGYNDLGIIGGNVSIINNSGNSWTFGADGTTTFPANIIAQTTNANLEIQTVSGGSLTFSRASGGSYMVTSDPIAFNAQSWSFETFVYLEDTGKNILAGVDTTPGLNIYFDGTTFVVQSDDGVSNTWSNVVPSLNTWHHIAVGYNGEGINAWLDGAQLTGGQQTTAAAGGDYGNNVLYIGATPWDASAGSAMKITNLRIVAGGTTLYDPNATTITVPPLKLTVVADTQLLLLANTSTTAYDDATGNYGITPTRMTWSSSTPPVTVGTNNWQFDILGNLYLPNNGTIATTGNDIVITNSSLLNGDITIQANNRVTVSGGDSGAPNTYGGWVYVSGGNGGPDSGVGVGGGGSVEIGGGLGANAINGGAGEGGEVRITGGAGGRANSDNSINAGNGGVVYIFGGQAGEVDGDNNLAVNGPAVEIHGGLGSFNGTTMIGRPGDVLTQGGGNGWIGASGNVYSKTSPDGYGFYTWGYINNGQTLYPIQNVPRGDTTSGTIGGYALVGGAGDQEFIISTPNGNASIQSSQRLVINPGKGADGTAGEGGDIYLWAGRGGSGDEANAVSAGSGGDIKIRGGQGGGWNGDGGYIRIEAGDASSTGGASGFIDITGGNSSVSAGGRIAITGGQGVTTGGDANITGGYGSGGDGGNVNILGGGSSLGAGHFGNVTINTGNTGNIWTFDQYGNLSIPNNSYITALMGTGGAGGANITVQAGASDASYYNSNPGGNLTLKGGYGSFADGGGGPGGDVIVAGGNSSDSHGGNVLIGGGSGTSAGVIQLNSDTYTPALNTGMGIGESAIIKGTRRLVGGANNPVYPYASVLNGTTASVVYQASSSFAYSVKVTFVVQSNNVTWGWEQFDVVAVKNFAGGVTVTVSNRVNSNPANGDTQVTAAQNADVIEITLQQPGAGTAYINYDAVEFNLMVD